MRNVTGASGRGFAGQCSSVTAIAAGRAGARAPWNAITSCRFTGAAPCGHSTTLKPCAADATFPRLPPKDGRGEC